MRAETHLGKYLRKVAWLKVGVAGVQPGAPIPKFTAFPLYLLLVSPSHIRRGCLISYCTGTGLEARGPTLPWGPGVFKQRPSGHLSEMGRSPTVVERTWNQVTTLLSSTNTTTLYS